MREIQSNNWKQRKRIQKRHIIYKHRRNNALETPEKDVTVDYSYSIKTEHLPTSVAKRSVFFGTFLKDCNGNPQINILEKSKKVTIILNEKRI